MVGLHVLGKFFSEWIFSEILKHEVQGISGDVQRLKKSMLTYGKNMPKIKSTFCFMPRNN